MFRHVTLPDAQFLNVCIILSKFNFYSAIYTSLLLFLAIQSYTCIKSEEDSKWLDADLLKFTTTYKSILFSLPQG